MSKTQKYRADNCNFVPVSTIELQNTDWRFEYYGLNMTIHIYVRIASISARRKHSQWLHGTQNYNRLTILYAQTYINSCHFLQHRFLTIYKRLAIVQMIDFSINDKYIFWDIKNEKYYTTREGTFILSTRYRSYISNQITLLSRAHTESTRHESTRSPPPLYPI